MKFLVLILVVLVVVMLAKAARGRLARPSDDDVPPAPPREATAPEGEVMLACAHCGLHLPRSDALPGRGGVYCSEGHRAIAEARHDRP